MLAEPTLIEVPVGAVDVTGMFQNLTIPSLVPTASSLPLGEKLMPQPCALGAVVSTVGPCKRRRSS